MKKLIRVYDIKWFYNYEDHTDQPKEEYDATFNAEPTEMIVDVTDWDFGEIVDDVDSIEEDLSNYISDESGYYHEGFSYEWVREETKSNMKNNNTETLFKNKKYLFKEQERAELIKQQQMEKLDKVLTLAVGTGVAETGKNDLVFIKAFLMGHIIGKYNRDITQEEMEYINSIKNKIEIR